MTDDQREDIAALARDLRIYAAAADEGSISLSYSVPTDEGCISLSYYATCRMEAGHRSVIGDCLRKVAARLERLCEEKETPHD